MLGTVVSISSNHFNIYSNSLIYILFCFFSDEETRTQRD